MTLKEYIQHALDKGQIEFHSFNPGAENQCVDLVNDYITKVWGLEAIIGTNAKDFPERLKSGMEFVKNTIDYLPNPGEIAVWNGRVGGGAGHIAVVIEKGKQTTFKSLDQNWSKKERITLETHKYNSVRGFIRKKGNMSNSKELEACMADRKKFWEERDQARASLKEANEALATKDKQIASYKGEVTKRETKIGELELEIQDLKEQKPTVIERFTSRKWLGAVLAIILPILNETFGWNLEMETVLTAVLPIIAFIGVEGFTDYKVRVANK